MLFYWFTAMVALIGVWLNIRKNVTCFYLWTFTNASWTYIDARHGIWPQAALQLVYMILALHGIRTWTLEKRRVNG